MMMTMMRNIYTDSRVSVSKHYVKHGSFLRCFQNLQIYDYDAMSSPFEVRRLLSHGGARVIGIGRIMCHMITDITANHRPSEFANSSRFTGSPVRSSQNTHTRENVVTGQLADKPTRRQPTHRQTNSPTIKFADNQLAEPTIQLADKPSR